MDVITWVWLISGIVLVVAELFIPGGVIAFLGASAILVALGQWIGWIDGLVDSFTYWFLISIGLTVAFRQLLANRFSGESHVEEIDEDLEAFGEIVEVVESISSQSQTGRIRFRGTTWKATTTGAETFARGEKVKLIERVDSVWIVQACSKNVESNVE